MQVGKGINSSFHDIHTLGRKSNNAYICRVGKEKAVPGETVAASPTTTVVKKVQLFYAYPKHDKT